MDSAPVLRYSFFFKNNRDFVVKQIVSFISATLLKKEPCCKFMLKYDIKSHFRQFTKILIIRFHWNTTHTSSNYATTWATFKPKLEKINKNTPRKKVLIFQEMSSHSPPPSLPTPSSPAQKEKEIK